MTAHFEPQELFTCRHCNAQWEESDWEYCPVCKKNYGGAVFPEVSTLEERRRAGELTQVIRRAFQGVKLGCGRTLGEADLEGT